MKGKSPPSLKVNIIEVYEDNFVPEMKRLSAFLDLYSFIGMDTEFPGTVYPCPNYSPGFYYKFIKTNVDKLKLIQLGITLCDEKGESPPEGGTWQFNLRFNVDKEPHSSESISMLSNCGINFGVLKRKGIHYSTFAEYFMVSGLILNDGVKWVSFNGFTDFAYLLRLSLNSNLPESEEEFISMLAIYFPQHYDIKILSSVNETLKGGLNKLAQQLGVERIGETHQAGSDSIVTADVFFSLTKYQYISMDELVKRKNILYGIGLGAKDEETILYTQFASNQMPLSMPLANKQLNPQQQLNQQQQQQQQQKYQSAYDYYPMQQQSYNAYAQQYGLPLTSYDQNQKSIYPYNLLIAYGN